MSANRWRWLAGILVALVVAAGAGLFLGLVVLKHQQTGRWGVPTIDDLVQVVVPAGRPRPSKIIYLDPGAATLTPGTDDAARGVSGVVAFHHPGGPVHVPGWRGSKAAWGKLVTCVRTLFAPFDVVVTDQRPAGDDYLRVVVGGRPTLLGLHDPNLSGLAPFNGQVIPRAIVFAFAAQLGNKPRATCETVAMEVAHAYGLDHEYLCKDVMTYLSCGARTFVDKDAPCGEKQKRACKGGAPTQNSYRRLLGVLGPAR